MCKDSQKTRATRYELSHAWEDEFGVKYSQDKTKLLQASKALKDYCVREGTKIICDEAFYHCNNLVSIHIPDSVTNIGEKDLKVVRLLLKYIFLMVSLVLNIAHSIIAII